jgi:glycosyltransferase involved in cell wall biosynthesis
MRVAINTWFWDSATTGSGAYTRHLVAHLEALEGGPELILVAPRGRAVAWGTPAAPPPADPGGGAPAKVWFEQVAFPRACRRLGVDVAHVPYWAPPLRPRVPTVVTIHDLIPLLLPAYRGGPAVRLYTALVGAAARHAALTLTDSRASQRDIVAHLGLPGARVRVVPLAAGGRYTPRPNPADPEVRARYDLPARYMLYLGGFDARKNLETALRTYRWAGPAIGTACPLIVAGRLPEADTALHPDPRRLAREQGLEPGVVRFIGFVDEAHKPALYRGATAFLFPSRYEGFGLPPLEALACGTPVVGSDAASLPEVVGDAGILLAPDDAAGMAGALIQLATDEAFRQTLSRRAVAQAERFSWARTASETLDAYRAVRRRRP